MMLGSQVVSALDSDSEQPATLDADDMAIDFASGVRTYRGNVLFRQGSIKMTCDELITQFNDDGELDEAVCIGSPGQFQQRPEGETEDMVGTANSITMDQVENVVTLKSRARVVQGGSTITGRIITYNLTTEKANITGGESQSSASTGGSGEASSSTDGVAQEENTRPSLVIQPRKKKDKSASKENATE